MIRAQNLTKEYKSKRTKNCVALDGISFELPDKGLVFIVGKSGSGKSTLLNMLGGLDAITSGEIEAFGWRRRTVILPWWTPIPNSRKKRMPLN